MNEIDGGSRPSPRGNTCGAGGEPWTGQPSIAAKPIKEPSRAVAAMCRSFPSPSILPPSSPNDASAASAVTFQGIRDAV
ncbi:hypothetical protein ACRE_063120 [Hapsidospora chrysogenum ATCC 11550]|uniref:Uncharacterized protein n=1 Tax=Hapsidospora chrysogenum (strain ATCC 11550 / CBS 779.69 / DSM 880 / IAM 14645 / JCM 23072 / IMI 49137) TaxID=857340 RepID=A0A086T0R2_HAPC1|nr:hypothetical protein ACRE_063120 [Hapsidospora chrysogenum ATCC 11550]